VPTLLALRRALRREGVRRGRRASCRIAQAPCSAAPRPTRSCARCSEAGADGRLGDIGAHFFSFGGVETTARWAAAAAAGQIVLDPKDGFAVAR
jgi:hypothetical protein